MSKVDYQNKVQPKCTFLKMLGCFNPILGQIWTNSNIGLKMSFKNVNVSIFDPKLG